ncbi:MAG: redoxin domain-containing protein [Labilithrix sp.]|nr:redoxin domain-containing protein [Labilithrix sp.]
MRTVLSLMATALVALSACGEDPPAKDPSSVNTKEADSKAGDSDGDNGGGGGGKSEISCKGKPEVGKNASSFSLSSVNGGTKMGVEKGKVTIIDFWATWCEPCKKSFPKYQELYVKYKASGLEILAISVDDEKKEIPDFIKTYGAKFPVGWDEGHKIADCYKPPNMPSAYVIDKNGVVKFVHNGYHDGEEKELEKEIKSLL